MINNVLKQICKFYNTEFINMAGMVTIKTTWMTGIWRWKELRAWFLHFGTEHQVVDFVHNNFTHIFI